MADENIPTDGATNGDEPAERGRLAIEPIEIQEEM